MLSLKMQKGNTESWRNIRILDIKVYGYFTINEGLDMRRYPILQQDRVRLENLYLNYKSPLSP